MQAGIKLVFNRFVGGILILVCLGPLINFFKNYANSMQYDHFMGGVTYIVMGLNFINFVIIGGIVIAIFYLYYDSTNKRKYGDEEETTTSYYGDDR